MASDYTVNHPDFTFGDTITADPDEVVGGLHKAMKEGRLKPDNDWDQDLRVFTAPLEPNTRFLVSSGRVISFRSETSPTGKRDMDREDDVWAVFSGGICATRDAAVIEWLEAHSGDKEAHKAYHDLRDESAGRRIGTGARECEVDSGLCRDCDWEAAAAWSEMKALQTATSRRSAQLPITLDLDSLFSRTTPLIGRSTNSDSIDNAVTAARRADREREKGR